MKATTKIVALGSMFLLALSLAAVTASAGTVTLWNVKGNGRSAEAQFSHENGGGRINLYQNGGQCFLFFHMWANDPNSLDCTNTQDENGNPIVVCVYLRTLSDYGWGVIPTNDVHLTNQSASLFTTTGAGFSVTHCAEDLDSSGVTTNRTCGPGVPVTFDLVWTADNISSDLTLGAAQYSLSSFTFTTLDGSRATSARVSGFANGRTLEKAPGWLGETKGRKVATQTVP